jgi:hypothetical protein
MLLQGDIKYGIKLPIGKNDAMKQTYLSSAIDDHSRYVLSSQFYDNQVEAIFEDTFRKSILKFGKFDSAKASGTVYSIVEMAKEHNIYIRIMFISSNIVHMKQRLIRSLKICLLGIKQYSMYAETKRSKRL